MQTPRLVAQYKGFAVQYANAVPESKKARKSPDIRVFGA
jgi:hypothetical protein